MLSLRLYIRCRRCGAKILLRSEAKTRNELPYSFELECFRRHRDIYYNYEAFAEIEPTKAPAGAIIGGLIGAVLAGPIGALGGAILAGGAGASADAADKVAVERFNAS